MKQRREHSEETGAVPEGVLEPEPPPSSPPLSSHDHLRSEWTEAGTASAFPSSHSSCDAAHFYNGLPTKFFSFLWFLAELL